MKKLDGNTEGWQALFIVFLATLAYPFTGWISAKVLQAIWGWFLEPQYGVGPSIRSWFGAGMLFTLFVSSLKSAKAKPDDMSRFAFWLRSILFTLMMQGALLLTAGWVRIVWGWT